MHVVAYVRPSDLTEPTGNGKHELHMVRGLSQLPDVHVSLLAARSELPEGRWPAALPALNLPVIAAPLARRPLELLWHYAHFPAADRYCPGADWIYTPLSVFVPARRARLAATFHCTRYFEPDLPEYHSWASRKMRWRIRRVFAPILARTDLLLAVSEFLKGRLVEHFHVRPERIAVVYNGVEECFYEAGRAGQPCSAQDPTFMVVGPLQSIKGSDYLLAAARALAARNPRARIRVALGQKSVPEFLPLARACPNVELLGYVGAPELAGMLAQSAALFCLSRYETFGIPVAEAMAAGTPVILSRNGALPEVAGPAGVFVDVTKPEELALAALELAQDPRLRARYAALGRQQAAQFTWPACARRLLAAMEHQ